MEQLKDFPKSFVGSKVLDMKMRKLRWLRVEVRRKHGSIDKC